MLWFKQDYFYLYKYNYFIPQIFRIQRYFKNHLYLHKTKREKENI